MELVFKTGITEGINYTSFLRCRYMALSGKKNCTQHTSFKLERREGFLDVFRHCARNTTTVG